MIFNSAVDIINTITREGSNSYVSETDYEGVNLTLIWDIISSDLPELNEQLNELYENI